MPPNPPLDRMATRSPGRSSATRARTISSTLGMKAASRALPADAVDELGLRQPLALRHLARQVGRRDDHPVGAGEGPGEAVLEGARLGRVGARLEHGHEAPAAPQGPQGRERRRHRRRVVGEVVVDGDAAGLASHLQAALDAPEGRRAPRGRPRARPRPRPRPPGPPARCGRCARPPSAGRTRPRPAPRAPAGSASPRARSRPRSPASRPPRAGRRSRPGSAPSAGSRRAPGSRSRR